MDATTAPWGGLPAIDPDTSAPMCGIVNGKILCCRSRGHKGRHATPFPSKLRHGPVWVYWGGPPLGPFGTCHATDTLSGLYCGLERGHEGPHLSPSNQGPGATLAEFSTAAASSIAFDVEADAKAFNARLDAMPPERAAREGDQPLPKPGAGDIILTLAREIPAQLLERRRLGIKRYGTSLQAHNGRIACRDLREELLDALAYSEQEAVERAKLEEDLRDEQGTRQGLEARLDRIWRLVPEEIRKGCKPHDVEDAVELLATAWRVRDGG